MRYVFAFAQTRYVLAERGRDMPSLYCEPTKLALLVSGNPRCSDEKNPRLQSKYIVRRSLISRFEYLACGEVFKAYRKSRGDLYRCVFFVKVNTQKSLLLFKTHKKEKRYRVFAQYLFFIGFS